MAIERPPGATGSPVPRLLSKSSGGGEPEKNEKTHRICDHRHEHAAGDRRVGLEPLERQRDQQDLNEYYKGLTTTNFKLPDSQSLTTEKEGLKQFYYVTAFPAGNLYAFRETEFPEEAKTVMKRFADVINFTYTRFNDLKQAEAQAREANIELALERVRARTMAMQKSDELSETAYVLFQQFGLLGASPEQLTIAIIDETHKELEFWLTLGGNQMNRMFNGAN